MGNGKTREELLGEIQLLREETRKLKDILSGKNNSSGRSGDEISGRKSNQNAVLMGHTLINAIPDLVWLKNPAGEYLACNTTFEKFFGAQGI